MTTSFPGRTLLAAITAAVLTGCAAAYVPPPARPVNTAFPSSAKPEDLMAAARRVLIFDGYQIASADDSSGTISTAMRDAQPAATDVDCGQTRGYSALLDKHTRVQIGYGIVVSVGRIDVKVNLQGAFKPEDGSEVIVLQCVSLGTLETAMARRIAASLVSSS